MTFRENLLCTTKCTFFTCLDTLSCYFRESPISITSREVASGVDWTHGPRVKGGEMVVEAL